MFNYLLCVCLGLGITASVVNGAIENPSNVGSSLEVLSSSNTSNATSINITIDINSCLPTLTRTSNCRERCGSMLSQPPTTIDTYDSASFEVQTAATLPNITYCEGHYYLLDGNCEYTFTDVNDNNKTYTLDVTWFYETTGNSGFNLILSGPTSNDTDATLHYLDYKDISSNDQLVCWWVYYNTSDTVNSCADETDDGNDCTPQLPKLNVNIAQPEQQQHVQYFFNNKKQINK